MKSSFMDLKCKTFLGLGNFLGKALQAVMYGVAAEARKAALGNEIQN